MAKVITSNLDDFTKEEAYAKSAIVGKAWEDRQNMLEEQRINKIKAAVKKRKNIKKEN